jgi:transposase-like protein
VPEFRHPCFQTGRVDLLPLVRRKESKKSISRIPTIEATHITTSESANTLMTLSNDVRTYPLSPEYSVQAKPTALALSLPKSPNPVHISVPHESATKTNPAAPKSPPFPTPPQPTESSERIHCIPQTSTTASEMERSTMLAQKLEMLLEAEMANKRAIEAMQAQHLSLRRELNELSYHFTYSDFLSTAARPPVPSTHSHLLTDTYKSGFPYTTYCPLPPHAHSTEIKRFCETLPEPTTASCAYLRSTRVGSPLSGNMYCMIQQNKQQQPYYPPYSYQVQTQSEFVSQGEMS